MNKQRKPLILVLSDLHIEGAPFQYKDCGEDVIILAGDIHTRNRHHELLDQIPSNKKIIFVAGNHEYYHGVFEDVKQYFRGLETKYSNFTFLDNEQTDVYGIPVYGGTMFTDFHLTGIANAFSAEQRASISINDFRVISRRGADGVRPWEIVDHTREFYKFVDGLNVFLDCTDKAPFRIVISHFMPTEKCVDTKYAGDIVNSYFAANMERYMGWNGLWVAGHGHNAVDLMLGDTRVVMNPRGYRNKDVIENDEFESGFVVEV